MDAIESQSSVHSHATGLRASKNRVNGSWNPLWGVSSRNLTHCRCSSTFAPQTPFGRLTESDRGSTCLTIPFQDSAKFGSRKPGLMPQARIEVLSTFCCSLMRANASARLHQLSTLFGCVIRPAAEICSGASLACHAPHASVCNSLRDIVQWTCLCSLGVARNSKAW